MEQLPTHATPTVSRKTMLSACCLIAFIAFGTGFAVATYSSPKSDSPLFKQLRQTMLNKTQYKFIDPLLSCSVPEQKAETVFLPLKNKVEAVIENDVKLGYVSQVSVYFDTRDGNWLGISTNEKYFPGSLMKVPTLITALKVAEIDPNFLNKKIVFPLQSPDYNSVQYFKPSKTMTRGQSYTIDDLLTRTIAYSDNNAVDLVIGNTNTEILQEIYTDLGVHLPSSPDQINNDFMTVKDYARFFKFLYNASYLSRNMSERALSLLAQTDFHDGISAGIPAGTVVAQKFGEHYAPDQTGQTKPLRELHDCGLIYHPLHPYLLCIMTKGNDYAAMSNSIKHVSAQVYNFIDTKY